MDAERGAVQAHYGLAGLIDRTLADLASTGVDTAALRASDLWPIDQLHHGGLPATEALAARAGVAAGMVVLDAGCGIGGTSRYLAEMRGCRVEAIDLTQDFVDAAVRLNALCGLDGRIAVRQGSVTALPYGDGAFDQVWAQNVTMNVADKTAMFAEAFRVLKPGGRFALTHLAEGAAGPPHYPLPWARTPAYSFAGRADDLLAALSAAGFVILVQDHGGTPIRAATQRVPVAVMGDDMPKREANARRSRDEGRLTALTVVGERPA